MINKFLFFVTLVFSTNVFAGAQQYEKLKEETKQMMSQNISDVAPNINSFSSDIEKSIWIKKQSDNLKKRVPDESFRNELLTSIHYEATRSGLDPELILGLIQVESGFKKYAISSVGAKGFMQVMPFWVDIIGEKTHNLFYLRTNLRYGCTILRYYLNIEKGDMFRALGRYNGSLGQSKYPNAVVLAMKNYH
ncbi:lytic transglycosylase domain-containing protein [archaeon]|nr:lytic transglycosylase domain-containing protein [archaeon]